MPHVTVIIPVYNCEEYIGEAIESVLAQTCTDWELVVIDDGSTDATAQVVGRYAHRLRYVRQENHGLAATRGRGVAMSRGALIAFLDADDIWLPRKLEEQIAAAAKHPDCGILTSDALTFSGERTITPSLHSWYRPASGDALTSLLFGNWIPPSAAMVRRECFDEVKTFDVPPPGYGEDWLMWMQIAAKWPVYFIDRMLVRRRIHSGAMSGRNDDTQFACLMRNFEIVRTRIPRLNQPPSLIDRAIYTVSYHRGMRDLSSGRFPEARRKFQIAVRHRTHAVSARLVLCAATAIPEPALRLALGAGRRTKAMLSQGRKTRSL